MDSKDQRVSDDEETCSVSYSDVKLCNVCVADHGSTTVLYCNTCQKNLKKPESYNFKDATIGKNVAFIRVGNSNMDDLLITERISEEMKHKHLVFGRLLQRCDEVNCKMDKLLQDITKEINSHFDKYIEALEKHRSRLLQQVREHSTRHADIIQNQKMVLSGLQENVNEARELLNTIKSGSLENNCEWNKLSHLLVDIRRAKVHVTSLKMSFVPDVNGPVIDGYQFYGQIVTGHACPDNCHLDYSGLESARVRHNSSVLLHVVQEEGKSYPCHVAVGAKILEPSGSVCKPKTLFNNMDGTWLLDILPRETGKHVLYVTVSGKPIKPQSVVFNVKQGWQEHTGRWHCCSVCSGSGDDPCTYGTYKTGNTCCSHLSRMHPGAKHWTCCGKLSRHSECDASRRMKRSCQLLSHSRLRPLSCYNLDLRRFSSEIKEVTL